MHWGVQRISGNCLKLNRFPEVRGLKLKPTAHQIQIEDKVV
jgi:hypothetical protein